MNSSKEVVQKKYPNASTVLLNKNMYYISSESRDKMSSGIALSGQYRKEEHAWEDAANRILKEKV